MTELKWKRINDCWTLKVNNTITIELDYCYGCYSVWMNEVKIGDCYDTVAQAKEKGLKVAKAIIEE